MTTAADHGPPGGGEYLLEGGLLWCQVCDRRREPAPNVDGARAYSCGPRCPVPDTPAVPVEQNATLAAMVRAHTVLHGVGRTAPHSSGRRATAAPDGPTAPLWDPEQGMSVTTEETRRWETCDLRDRRALLRAAYHRLEVDKHGVIHRIWRHEPHPDAGRHGEPS